MINFSQFPAHWTLERATDVLNRQAKRDAAQEISIESIDHAANLIREQQEEIAILEKSLERVQSKKEEFCAATARLDALMKDKRDELIASAREGREPDYREIDAQLAQVRDVLAQYADEQVNVPAAIASIESTLSDARAKADAVLRAAQQFVSRHYRAEYDKAHQAYIDFLNSAEFLAKLENMHALFWLYRAFDDRYRTGLFEGEVDQVEQYLEGIKHAGGKGVLDSDRTRVVYRDHLKRLEEFGITKPDLSSDPCPSPLEVHIAKRVYDEFQQSKLDAEPVTANR
ncbi:hypothetical protein WT56_22425 [Burkholderia pseudomultivorans]|uniref:Uncharacterized protein n=2 Tax=Burkholderia pseudomultivorans TaxID=1207504 RepID=A0A132EDI3_9BURK|nr:hypothetical protein WT56_22425 [Burkholderia pseudomultivorans]